MRLVVAVVLAAAAFGTAAPSASAGDVVLWACHGPNGEALSTPLGSKAAPSGTAASTCDLPGGGLRAPAGSGWTFDMPSGAALNNVRILHTLDDDSGDGFELKAGSTTLEPKADGTDATGSQVQFTCTADCTGVNVPAIGFRVTDTGAPHGAVSGFHSPASDTVTLDVPATDDGVGLQSATAEVDGTPVSSAGYGDADCKDISTTSPGMDLPFGLVGQNDVGQPPLPVGCVGRGTVSLSVDTRTLTDGGHRLEVLVTDLAGNPTPVMDQTIEVHNAPSTDSATRSLQIGSGGVPTATANATTRAAENGVASAQATSCLAPQLSVVLADRPLRIKKGVPVLRSGGRYKFTGRLTCQVGNRRRVAPKHAILDILSRIGKRTRSDYGTTTAPRGVVSVILSFTKSRTLIFRFTSAENKHAEVRIRIIVEKARPFPRSLAIHAIWLRFTTPFARVRFTQLEARNVPAGARVSVTCAGEGCPRAHRAARARHKRPVISVLGPLASSDLRPGASLNITVTKPGFVGIGKLYCVRAGQRVVTRPYKVGDTQPSC